ASWSNFLGMFQIFPSTQTEQNLGHFNLPESPSALQNLVDRSGYSFDAALMALKTLVSAPL
ncbi:hypothetical protein QP926_08310, partial [Corynebacterium accolens]|nr:hypothetical protein [Corynebacterium accolens]MDK8593363.1 hypothetical protein [Corynebacterium accolens]